MGGKLQITSGDKAEQKDSWDLKKLASFGVDEKLLREANPSAQQLMDLVKGLLYLKEMYPQFWE